MNKHSRISAQIGSLSQEGLSPYYSGFFERFNKGEFFEAHDVLEQLWLKDRQGPDGAFYKGLIQLAGAFVHVRKGRNGPALALFNLAQANLRTYPSIHQRLNLSHVLDIIDDWQRGLASDPTDKIPEAFPRLVLEDS